MFFAFYMLLELHEAHLLLAAQLIKASTMNENLKCYDPPRNLVMEVAE